MVVLLGIVASAVLIRLVYLDDVHFLGERQYRSALIARHMFVQNRSDVPEWRKDVVEAARSRIGSLEPPITEWAVSMLYRLAGRENLLFQRLLTLLVWTVASLLVFACVYRLAGAAAALGSAAYVLFVPLGVLTSLSFLPDVLMFMLLCAGLLLTTRYVESPTPSRLVIAALACSGAILTKVVCVFPLAVGFLAGSLGSDLRRRTALLHSTLFLTLAALPSVIYYRSVVATQGSAAWASRFMPSLLVTRDYWTETLSTAAAAAGAVPIVLGLVGWAILQGDRWRWLIGGWWLGYVLFCLTFTNSVRFASYYHLQLIPIVAISGAPVVRLVLDHVSSLPRSWPRYVGTTLSLVVLAAFLLTDIRSSIAGQRRPVHPSVAREIGELVRHSTRTVLVASYYGVPLRYHGELAGMHWYGRYPGPIAGDDPWSGRLDWRNVGPDGIPLSARLDALGYDPDYFIVTDFDRFARVHSDLRQYLEESCSEAARSNDYLIFHECGDGPP